jgi:transcriptional regulator with XRE-family HTH domain
MVPPTDSALVGQILREARIRAGLRQDDVAAALGMRQTLVSKYELGQIADPGLRVLVRFCDLLDIDPCDLAQPLRTPPNGRRRKLTQVAS